MKSSVLNTDKTIVIRKYVDLQAKDTSNKTAEGSLSLFNIEYCFHPTPAPIIK